MATQKGRNWSSGDIVTAANLSSIERGVSAVAEEYTPTTWANGNTVTAAALNNIEQGIVNAGGGGGSGEYLGLRTATVDVILDTSAIEENVTGFESVYVSLYLSNSEYGNVAMNFHYSQDGIPVTELGGLTRMSIPISDGYYSLMDCTYFGSEGSYSGYITEVISGDATMVDNYIRITGDCTLVITVNYD